MLLKHLAESDESLVKAEYISQKRLQYKYTNINLDDFSLARIHFPLRSII